MSKKGIKIVSKIFCDMQQARQELLKIGTKEIGTSNGNQDIELGQLLEIMKDAGKHKFIKITSQ